MTVRDVEFHDEALAEIEDAKRWYRAQSPASMLGFARELDHALEIIAEYPELPTPYLHRTRRLLLRRFPFAVIYRLLGQSVFVVAMAHLKRREGYWADR